MSAPEKATIRPVTIAGEQCLVISVPLHINRRRGRREIIVPAGLTPEEPVEVRTNEPLALTIVRAHRWRELLDEDHFESASEPSRSPGLSHACVDRFLRLAQDTIEAILAGTEPSGPSLAVLAALPLDWESQRERVGRHADISCP